MSIDLSKATALSDQYGNIVQLELGGRVIWMLPANDKPVILQVEKITSDTYAGETTYTGEQFILLDIYPKTNGTVKVTYGGLTKTITDTSGAEEPNAQQVFFGTFNGASDSVVTPASGELTIEGQYSNYAVGTYSTITVNKTTTKRCSCITGVVEWGSITSIANYAFGGCTKLSLTELPNGITSIGDGAFGGCKEVTLTELPIGIVSIGSGAFNECVKISLTRIPEGVTSIGSKAFYVTSSGCAMRDTTITLPSTLESIGSNVFSYEYDVADGTHTDYCYLNGLVMLSEIPPTLTGDFSESFESGFKITVPQGCGEAYKTAEYWSKCADRIVEAS